jgi:hypothetical protein
MDNDAQVSQYLSMTCDAAGVIAVVGGGVGGGVVDFSIGDMTAKCWRMQMRFM